jgi:hypothetical protein
MFVNVCVHDYILQSATTDDYNDIVNLVLKHRHKKEDKITFGM